MKKQFLTLAAAGLLLSFTACEKTSQKPKTTDGTTTTTDGNTEVNDGIGDVIEGFQKSSVSLSAADYGIADAAQFKMGPVATDGKYVFIVNNKAGNYGILVYNIAEKKVQQTIKEWTVNGTTEKFMGEIRGLSVANGKLYAANIRYRVDVFNSKDLSFLTTIGSGSFLFDVNDQPNPNGLLSSFSVVSTGGKVLVRDKSRLVAFLEADVTPENYKKVPIFSASVSIYHHLNDDLEEIPMAVTPDGNVVISARKQKKLCFINVKSITKENELWIDESRSINNLPAPVDAVVATKDAYLLLMDGKIYKYTIDTKVIKEIGSALALAKSFHLYKDGEKIWLASENNQINVLNILNK